MSNEQESQSRSEQWVAVTGDDARLKWGGKRSYFPHILINGKKEIIVNWASSLEDCDKLAIEMADRMNAPRSELRTSSDGTAGAEWMRAKCIDVIRAAGETALMSRRVVVHDELHIVQRRISEIALPSSNERDSG